MAADPGDRRGRRAADARRCRLGGRARRGLAADVASRGQGIATFLRDLSQATRDFVRTLTPADVLTYTAGVALNRALGPLINRTIRRWLGEASEETAETAAERAAHETLDDAVPSSRIVPGGGLAAHEALGGHTLARHVGQTPDQLRARLEETGYGAISTYTDRAGAEAAIAEVIGTHQNVIDSWLLTTKTRLGLDYIHDGAVGITLLRGATEPVPANGSRLVLERAADSPLGYRIVTGFPEYLTKDL